MQTKLSPSTLGLFSECALCFWMQFRRGIKHPEGIFPSLPGGMDRILKEHFDRHRRKGLLPPELKSLEGMRLFDNINLLDVWRNIFRGGLQHADRENGFVLCGALDEVLVSGDRLAVLDFKTRGSPLRNGDNQYYKYYQDQMDIYTYLLQRNGFQTESFAFLLFYYPDKVRDDGSVLFGTELKKIEVSAGSAERLFRSAVECLLSDEPPEESGECGHCRYAQERRGR